MKSAGMGGYFMHARGGLEKEYLSSEWFDCVSAGVEQAEKNGMWHMTKTAGPAALPTVSSTEWAKSISKSGCA